MSICNIFESCTIRSFVAEDQTVWFHLKDICDALGIKNSRDWASKVNVLKRTAKDSLGRPHDGQNFVREQDLYTKLLPRSKLPAARRFLNWMGDVIKQIRLTGSYSVQTPQLKMEQQKLDNETLTLHMELVKMALTLGDALTIQLAQDKLKNLMQPTHQLAIESQKMKTVSEILEQTFEIKGKQLVSQRIRVGSYVAKRYREQYSKCPDTTTKYVHGHPCAVKIYQNVDEVTKWIETYLSEQEC